jgi:isoquinoline 1-oxidoreductase subunit beta
MNSIENVSRRGFLKLGFAAGSFVLAARIIPAPLWADDSKTVFSPDIFLSISPDNTITIIASRSEMGCGSRTGVPLVLADELDADWSKVKIQQATGDAKYGDQDTDGSHSIRSFFDQMRMTGATARAMLITAAAKQWNVREVECTTDPSEVVHKPTGKRLTYGQLAAIAATVPVPPPDKVMLKKRSEWRLIGSNTRLYDVPDIVTGKAQFGMDAKMPGMVYAAIAHPPVLGQKVKSYDDSATLKVKGVKQTLTIDPFKPPHEFQPLGGVAVIADNTWAAFQGRQALKVTWDSSPNSSYNSAEFRKTLEPAWQGRS